MPSAESRSGQSASGEALDAPIVGLRAEAARLREARAGLLSGLLDRTIDIESAELEV